MVKPYKMDLNLLVDLAFLFVSSFVVWLDAFSAIFVVVVVLSEVTFESHLVPLKLGGHLIVEIVKYCQKILIAY